MVEEYRREREWNPKILPPTQHPTPPLPRPFCPDDWSVRVTPSGHKIRFSPTFFYLFIFISYFSTYFSSFMEKKNLFMILILFFFSYYLLVIIIFLFLWLSYPGSGQSSLDIWIIFLSPSWQQDSCPIELIWSRIDDFHVSEKILEFFSSLPSSIFGLESL